VVVVTRQPFLSLHTRDGVVGKTLILSTTFPKPTLVGLGRSVNDLFGEPRCHRVRS